MNKLSIQYDSKRFNKAENALIEKALDFAIRAHGDQFRASGGPYVDHPIAVAEIVADWGMDCEAVQAALLHDVVEDTPVTLEELTKEFGSTVSELVQGLTKLKLSATPRLPADSTRQELNNENLRKLLLATTKDFRVILIKLADRLHNMRTLGALPEDKRLRIARESLEVFAPLADRLGMGQLKCELEDLGFAEVMPGEYKDLRRQVERATAGAAKYLAGLKRAIVRHLKHEGVEIIKIEARQKHYFSIYRKLVKTGDIDKIYDLVAVRIIVADVAACYQALGILHQHYKPLIYRIKDYIAVPKPNGYQSLHTTVFGESGRISEIQIRTPQMHEAAEFGLAAHFYYDSHKSSSSYVKGRSASALPANMEWVKDVAHLQTMAPGGQEFADGAKLELFSGRIFVFSPKGDLYDLPEGSTPLDFAFAVHSDIGLRTQGAKVNGRMVPLSTPLENRDVVDVVTRREPAPSRDWLSLVVTSHAKSRIRSWFRASSREANIVLGRQALEVELQTWGIKRLEEIPKRTLGEALDALHIKSADDLFAYVGDGTLTLAQAIRRLVPNAAKPTGVKVVKRKEPTGRVLVEQSDLPYSLAPCCNPQYPMVLIGYVTRGKGVTVHALGCRNVPADYERYVTCRWETAESGQEMLACVVLVKSVNRLGLLSDLTGTVAKRNLNMANIRSQVSEQDGTSTIEFTVEVPDFFVFANLVRDLSKIPGVSRVSRIST